MLGFDYQPTHMPGIYTNIKSFHKYIFLYIILDVILQMHSDVSSRIMYETIHTYFYPKQTIWKPAIHIPELVYYYWHISLQVETGRMVHGPIGDIYLLLLSN